MKIIFVLLFLLTLSLSSWALEINYKLEMSKPQTHYFQVEMQVDQYKGKTACVKLPVWAPGSYLVREFSKNLNLVKAFDTDGRELKVTKRSKNAWEIALDGKQSFKVRYEVYAFELSVRTSFLDQTHGFVSGPSMFMYLDGFKNNAGKLAIVPHSSFKKVSTGLELAPVQNKGAQTFLFSDYDQLVDSPIEVGNQETFEFMAAGVRHTVCMYGTANYDVVQLKKDMAKIVEEETKVFNVNPNKNYLFIIHNVIGGDGGLEHANSTVLSVDRWTYDGADYVSFLNLVAHEYFHLWNVKRIRPIELGPFDYDKEVYTTLLWVMEGFTSYYDELIMLRSGFYKQEEFLNKLQSSINYVEGSVGSRVQPVAHASFDAWVKAYRPNENSSNTTMTYYSRGSLLAAVFDAMIIKNSGAQKGLDHFLQDLYQTYYLKLNRGFTEGEFKTMLEKHTGQELSSFFAKYIDGTEVIPFTSYFGPLGLEVSDVGGIKPVFGATVADEGGRLLVKAIRAGGSAEEAGLSVNDEIISCMDYRLDKGMFDAFVGGLEVDDAIEFTTARDRLMRKVKVKMLGVKRSSFVFNYVFDENKKTLYNYWLR